VERQQDSPGGIEALGFGSGESRLQPIDRDHSSSKRDSYQGTSMLYDSHGPALPHQSDGLLLVLNPDDGVDLDIVVHDDLALALEAGLEPGQAAGRV